MSKPQAYGPQSDSSSPALSAPRQGFEIFPWNDSFNTGIAEIDAQHRNLVALLNKAANHVTFNQPLVNGDTMLNELFDYANYHFKTEEQHWQSALSDTPQTQEHKQSHDLFIQHIIDLKNRLETTPEDIWVEELLSFLSRWLASHILESDRYMAFLASATKRGLNDTDARAWAEEQMEGTSATIIGVILAAYEKLTANTLQLMREIRTGKTVYTQLLESEHRLRGVMEYAQVGFWELPYNSKRAKWSSEMFHIFGLPEDTPAGPDTLCGIMDTNYCDIFLNSVHNSFATGYEHHVEYPITRPNDGQVRWIECRGKIYFDEDSKPVKAAGFIQDITLRKEHENRIEQLAYYDPLTSLPNRRLLLDRLSQSLVSSHRKSTSNALLFLDIDNFKSLNDTHGHVYGDYLLKETAQRVNKCTRSSDTVSRIGNDEFLIILEGLEHDGVKAAKQAEAIAHKILDMFAEPFQLDRLQYNTTSSIGITLYNDDSLSASELMQQADIAMNQAKKTGRNTSCFFDPEMQKHITEKVKMESDLRNAIGTDQFEMHYQKQVDDTGATLGAEALVRWKHPENGMIPPNTFIPLAEDTGLIIPLGEWIFRTGCQQLAEWQTSEVTKDWSLAINVSYIQFRQPDFIAFVTQAIQDFDINPQKLKIELTETQVFEDMDLTLTQMLALRELGIEFSLDDFGTGYSSLQHLKRLPISQLKIDKSFIQELGKSKSDRAIVRTIVSMADSLRLNVIAEGVETLDHKDYLLRKGCTTFQGYLFAKPVPASELQN